MREMDASWRRAISDGKMGRKISPRGQRQSRTEAYAVARKSAQAWRSRAMMWLGGKCERCGIADSRVLQFDHKDGGGTPDFKISRGTGSVANKVFKQVVAFQLLCANCNWIKRFEQNEQAGYLKSRSIA